MRTPDMFHHIGGCVLQRTHTRLPNTDPGATLTNVGKGLHDVPSHQRQLPARRGDKAFADGIWRTARVNR
jgi:hypothetical protein